MMGRSPVQGAQAVTRSFAVLRAVARARDNGTTLAQLVREVGLNKPTVHRLLMALVAEGMVEQDAQSRLYHLGTECCALGAVATLRFGYKQVAANALGRLAQYSGDSAFFCIQSGTFSVCVLHEEGDYWLQSRVQRPSTRRPLGVAAAGLSILAELQDAEVDQCLASNAQVLADTYPQFTPALIRRHVRETRKRGYSLNNGLLLAGAWGIGVPVKSPDGSVLGAISIGAVESHMGPARQKELAPRMAEEARLLEQHLRELETVRPG